MTKSQRIRMEILKDSGVLRLAAEIMNVDDIEAKEVSGILLRWAEEFECIADLEYRDDIKERDVN